MQIFFLTLAILIGWLFVHLASPGDKTGPRWAIVLFELALGAGGGVGLVSFLFFLQLLFHAASAPVALLIEMLLVCTAVGLGLFKRSTGAPGPDRRMPVFWWYWILGGALIISVLAVIAGDAKMAQLDPYGRWDAFAMWNLRAKYLAAPDDSWRNAFSPLLGPTHPDYPLLTSGFIAHLWKFSGERTSTLAPILTATLFAASLLALIVGALALVRSTGSALLAGLTLTASSSFLIEPMSQYADVPLSFYYLATLVLLLFSTSSEGSHSAMLAGMAGAFASFAAWTKNEGLSFLVVSLVCYTVIFRHDKKAGVRMAPRWCFLIGATPGLLVAGYFKIFLAPANDLTNQTTGQALHRFIEFDRYFIIAKSMIYNMVFQLGELWANPLLLLAILAVFLHFQINERHRKWLITAVLTLSAVWLVYFSVYLVTPYDLRVHLGNSLDRLFAQVWPSCLFVVFMMLTTPETALDWPGTKQKVREII
jgi:hypothetical protein